MGPPRRVTIYRFGITMNKRPICQAKYFPKVPHVFRISKVNLCRHQWQRMGAAVGHLRGPYSLKPTGARWSKKKGCFGWREGGLTVLGECEWSLWRDFDTFMEDFEWFRCISLRLEVVKPFEILEVGNSSCFFRHEADCIRPVLGPCLGQDLFFPMRLFSNKEKQTAEELVRIFYVTSCL